MKALIFSLCLVSISSIAHAGLVGDFPKVQFGSTFVSVDEVCVSGNNVKTISEVTVCTKRDNRDHGYCAQEESKILSTPIHYTKELPYGHNKFRVVDMTIALDYKISFGTPSKNGIRVTKTEDFSIPACE